MKSALQYGLRLALYGGTTAIRRITTTAVVSAKTSSTTAVSHIATTKTTAKAWTGRRRIKGKISPSSIKNATPNDERSSKGPTRNYKIVGTKYPTRSKQEHLPVKKALPRVKSKSKLAQKGASKSSPSKPKVQTKLDLFVSCLPGLEPILSAELHSLGIAHTLTVGGATLPKDGSSLDQLLQCHLYLGSASHVLLRCGEPFRARGLAELRRKVAQIDWSTWLLPALPDTIPPTPMAFLDIRVSSAKSKLVHTVAVAERVEQGIHDSLGLELLKDAQGNVTPIKRISNDHENKVKLAVRLQYDMVSISMDTSLSPLHQRGYRLETAKAPLREDLAFALLYSAGWTPNYNFYKTLQPQEVSEGNDGGDPPSRYESLLDPFCGSGTIAIEGASMAIGLPPGRLRAAPLAGTRLYAPKLWHSMVNTPSSLLNMNSTNEDSDKGANDTTNVEIQKAKKIIVAASDRDAGAVNATIANAKRAGVLDWMDIQCCAIAAHPWLDNASSAPDTFLVATNPPFGKRIGSTASAASGTKKKYMSPLLPLYQTLGAKIRRVAESKTRVGAAILAQDREIVRQTGLPSLKVSYSAQHGGLAVSAMVVTDVVSSSKD